jgi:hypothetical protein
MPNFLRPLRIFSKSPNPDDEWFARAADLAPVGQVNIVSRLLGRHPGSPATVYVPIERSTLVNVNSVFMHSSALDLDLCNPEHLFTVDELKEVRSDLAELERAQQGSEADASTIGL